jgi:hypothetical protein
MIGRQLERGFVGLCLTRLDSFAAGWHRRRLLDYTDDLDALVAQPDRAPDFESGGREFESLRARHFAGVLYTPENFWLFFGSQLLQLWQRDLRNKFLFRDSALGSRFSDFDLANPPARTGRSSDFRAPCSRNRQRVCDRSRSLCPGCRGARRLLRRSSPSSLP